MQLKTQLKQPWEVIGPPALRLPQELPVRLEDGEVVDAGLPPLHQPILVELPILIAVGSEPVVLCVAVLVLEAHGNAVVPKGPLHIRKIPA
eukprot:scaffold385_cov305-Pinguiococcus_pyrenoidosus.AAC.20